MLSSVEELQALGQQVVERARSAGAEVAEAIVQQGNHLSTKVRKGEAELVEEAGSRSLGLRVMHEQRVAMVYTSDLSQSGLRRLVDDAIELVRLAEKDPHAGPPDPSLLSRGLSAESLALYDAAMSRIGAAEALERAKAAEAAAFAFDPRVTNSEGATFTRVEGAHALVTSGGFSGGYRGSYASLTVHPVVDDSDGKKRSGYYWSARRHLNEMESPESVGKEAARRTLAKLGSQKLESQNLPVIFDPDAARSMLGLVAGCISGSAVWRRSTYLAERLGDEVASPLVTIIDDPLLVGGPGSRPFDGEGLASRRNTVIEAGVLRTFLNDSYCARKLGMESTASASRGSSGGVSPSTSNFILQPGTKTPEEILKESDRAFYVTEMMGFGFNAVTGDFSRGAAGFWVEGGEKRYPVSEVTISLNLDTLLKRIDAVGNDLDLRTSIASPTFRVSSMTLAGR